MHIPSSRFFPLTFLCLLFYESHLSSLISFVPLVSPYSYLPLHLHSPALRMYRGSSKLTHYSEYYIFWDLPSALLWPIIGHLHFQEFWDSRWFSQRCLVYQKLEARKKWRKPPILLWTPAPHISQYCNPLHRKKCRKFPNRKDYTPSPEEALLK